MAASHKGLVCDERLVEAAENIIAAGSGMVSKPVRAGMTTSTIIACERKDRRLLVLAPTRRILKETVERAAGNATLIPANSECKLMEPDLKKNPILYQLPLALPDCTKCTLASGCEVLEILRVEDPKVMCLTYHKLEALMLSRGGTAGKILEKLSRAEVIMADECHELALPTVASVKAFATVKIPEKYTALERVQQAWLLFCENHVKTIKELMHMAESGHASQHLSRDAINLNPLPWAELTKAWPQLRKLAVTNELLDEEILQIRDIITIMAADHVALSYATEEEGETGAVYLSAGQVRLFRAMNEFLVQHEASVLFVSGTNFEPQTEFFSVMSGRKVKNVIFPDIRRATQKMALIPDSWKLTSRNFSEKLSVILATISAIVEREKQAIYLLAPNGRKAAWLRKELKKIGLTSVFVDFYRSDRTIGVEHNERICIALGLAETPANTCDALAYGDDPDKRWLDSRRLRQLGVDAATWQAVNRVRDPAGLVESRVYFIGCRLDQVRRVATWGTNRVALARPVKESRGNKGESYRTVEFDVKVDEEIELPKIHGEDKNGVNPSRRKLSELIGRLEFYKNSFKKSQNPVIPSNNIYRGNDAKLGIYNIPSNETKLDLSANTLYFMFVNRTDCYARQSPGGGYTRYCSPLTIDLIKRHIRGTDMLTVGTYQIGLDDTVTWCCDDIDSHNGETDAREKVGRLVAVCRTYSIPFLLETSGSMDSYHLWILLGKTRTYNAYRFIRQLNAESKVNCECFPKQKRRNKNTDGGYGNQVKLPVCLNLKSGGRSAFLDADTFEPLEGLVTHPGLVHLLEIPELIPSGQAVQGMPKPATAKKPAPAGIICGTCLDHCMERALADNLALEGGAGHNLRLAIATKAKRVGLDAEATVRLFEHQADYNHDFSLKKVLETWSYNYSPWSCAVLRDKCGSLIAGYCQTCPFRPAAGFAEEVVAV